MTTSDLGPDPAAELAYVALVVDDPETSAAIFEKDFGLPREDFSCGGRNVPAVAVGRSVLAMFRPDDSFLGGNARKGVHHIAIAADDPRAAADASGLDTVSSTAEGLGGRPQIEFERNATCGVRVRLTPSLGLHPASSDIVERLDHICVASADNAPAKDVFIGRLGCVYESQQTDSETETLSENFTSDTYNYIFHTRPSQLIGSMRVTFITVGDTELEFIQDLTTSVKADEARHDRAGTTRGDRSAIARFIATHGQGLHHVAFKTPDVTASLAKIAAAGHRVIDRVGRPGSRASLIGFMHPTMIGGVLMHFVQREDL